ALFSKSQNKDEPDTRIDMGESIAAPPPLAQPPSDWELPAPTQPAATPSPAIVESGSVLDDKTTFRAEAQKLAKARDWQGLAALPAAALDVSKWAAQPEIRAALLADLARVYRDRLRDLPSAEDQFRRLIELVPANSEANRFLGLRWRERHN